MKKITAAAAAFCALSLALTGCSESILTSSGTASDIWTANDTDIVAYATGEGLTDEEKEYYNIEFKDFYAEYRYTIDNYGIDESNPSYEDYAKHFRENVITTLTNEKIILKKAEEAGLAELSEKELEEIEAGYAESMKNWYIAFEADALKALGAETADDVDADTLLEKEKALFEEYVTGFGLSEDIFLTWETNSHIQKKMFNELCKDVTVSDKEVEDYINSVITSAKAAYEKSAADYEANGEYAAVWIPEGSRRIKYVFLGIPSADAAEITAAREESGADDAAIDAMRDEALAKIKDQIEAAYKKIKDGVSFDDVVKEYSNDYSEETAGQTSLVVKGNETLSREIYDAVFAIEEVGGVSGIIPTDRGYYIIQYASKAEITEENMEEVRTLTKDGMLSEKQNEATNSALEKWQNEIGYKFDYEKLNFDAPEKEDEKETSSADETASKSEESEKADSAENKNSSSEE